ncbi:MAG: radical SAM protein [Anaerolineales bacterium]|uniref:Radical SAM protein n=1 Tax=Candidatus Desulfolinea nitratireducens TaxID=2841698 RepID=A0A8J6TFQ0_9CHLR|nr:radical SAM protein [Candidatus Desulfolinea nitratireducens]MBL6959665.1 radical SAM protein [Anaerolineales bacterium]
MPIKKRPFGVVQIEVTSRCGTGCVFCPHDALSDRWVEGDLPLGLYSESIAPHLNLFELVYLQGWGEPMLHPHLWEMLEMAQQQGCQTGFTTNGTYLQDDQNRRLLDMGVNLISVSFAGTVASVHESLRTKSEFTKLCRNFENLANLKRKNGVTNPWLELHFLMTRTNLTEFPSLVELAASLGADEVVATNLTYSPSITLDHQHVFGEEPLLEDMEIVNQAKMNAERLNIPLRIYPLKEEPNTAVCDSDPVNTVYVNHRGEVTPCVYLGLTLDGQIPRFYQGESHPFDTVSFGNVCDGFTVALDGVEREKFVSAFKRRNVGKSPLAMFSYLAGDSGDNELSPPPIACQHCYKMLGI